MIRGRIPLNITNIAEIANMKTWVLKAALEVLQQKDFITVDNDYITINKYAEYQDEPVSGKWLKLHFKIISSKSVGTLSDMCKWVWIVLIVLAAMEEQKMGPVPVDDRSKSGDSKSGPQHIHDILRGLNEKYGPKEQLPEEANV